MPWTGPPTTPAQAANEHCVADCQAHELQEEAYAKRSNTKNGVCWRRCSRQNDYKWGTAMRLGYTHGKIGARIWESIAATLEVELPGDTQTTNGAPKGARCKAIAESGREAIPGGVVEGDAPRCRTA